MIRFANPWVLALFIFLPIVIFLVKRFEGKLDGSVRFSSQNLFKDIKPSFKVKLSRQRIYMRAMCLVLLIMAAARPQSSTEETRIYVEGIDIVLAVDTSGSMRAMDFEIGGRRFNRLEVVKDVMLDFIEKRTNDKVGMVAFSALAYTVCPLTLDHDWLERNIERVQIGMIEDGTAIGAAISGALNRLKETEAKEKIIILLTDGRNNAGSITPIVAAEAAAALGVKIYTVGAGTNGLAPYPMKDMFGDTVLQPVQIEIDEKLLKKIAEITGGMYFRATDTESLKEIYKKIDELETTPMEEVGYNIYRELFGFLLIPALLLLLLEVFLFNTVLRRIP